MEDGIKDPLKDPLRRGERRIMEARYLESEEFGTLEKGDEVAFVYHGIFPKIGYDVRGFVEKVKLKGNGVEVKGKIYVGNKRTTFERDDFRIFEVKPYQIDRIEHMALVSRRD